MALNDFARQLDISPAYWSRIERDRENPPKDALILGAAKLLGEDPDGAFIAAQRLPPDLREHLREIVRMYRENGEDSDAQRDRDQRHRA